MTKKPKPQNDQGIPSRPNFEGMVKSIESGRVTLATGAKFVREAEAYATYLEAQIPPAGVITPVVIEEGPTLEQRVAALEGAVFPKILPKVNPDGGTMLFGGTDDEDLERRRAMVDDQGDHFDKTHPGT